MRFLISMTCLLISSQVLAAKIEYSTYENAQSEYVNVTKISCAANDDTCVKICNDQNECIKEEGLCTNCAGSNDFFMRLLFTKSKDNFIALNTNLNQEQMIQLLTETKYVLVTYKSVYNFYKAWGSEEVKNDFSSFCPQQKEDPILIINLNEKYQPQNVAGVICSDKKSQSYVRLVQDKNLKKEEVRLTTPN